MRVFAQKHVWGILCAVLSGAIMVLPQILLPYSIGYEYKGIAPLLLDDEDIYRARIHEVLEGNIGIASPYLHEYKDNSVVVVPPLNEWLYAIFAVTFGLSGTIIASKFILPALLFFLTYLLLRKLLEGDDTDAALLGSLAGSFLVVLGTDLIDYQHLSAIVRGEMGQKAMLWGRIVNPISGAVGLFCFLVVLLYSLRGSYAKSLLAGGILSVLVGYFFSFALAYTILGSLIFFSILLRDWERLKRLFLVALSSLILDIPYWWSTLHSIGGAEGKLLATRNGMFFTHEAIVNKVLLAASFMYLLMFTYAYFTKKLDAYKEKWIFTGALLLGSWLAFNQQIITGREIWYHHFVQYTIPLVYVSLITASFYSVRTAAPKIWRFGMSAIIVVSIAYGVLTSWAGALPYRDEMLRQQKFAAVFEFLNASLGNDCVVLVHASTETLEKNIPAYTSCDVYSTSYVFIGIPQERILHNYFLHMRLLGVTKEETMDYLLTHEAEVRHVTFSNWRQLFGRERDKWYLDQVEYLARTYEQFLKGNLTEQINSYQVDYIISDEQLSPALLSSLPGLKLATTTEEYYIYTF